MSVAKKRLLGVYKFKLIVGYIIIFMNIVGHRSAYEYFSDG